MPTPYYHPFNEQIVFWDCLPLLGGAIRASESSDKLDLTRENYFDKISRFENEVPNENVKERLGHLKIWYFQLIIAIYNIFFIFN